ncbi:MAG: lipase family protein [Candidatus Nanopelagicales bacterium]
MSRMGKFLAAIAVALVGGILLYVTAPATSLVDAPISPEGAGVGETIDAKITPALSNFYDVGKWTPGAPGTLVKAEPVPGAPAGIKLYRIMYQSTDLQGKAIPVTGLYAVPAGPAPAGGYPLVSFAHGTTGVGRMCGMSQTPLQPNTPANSNWVPHIEPLVKQGWAVVASDYSGMGAPGPSSYLVGPLEGRGILDALRAVETPSPLIGLVPINTGKLGVYGKSQGGESAMSAIQLAPHYAPELNIDGGVILAPGFTPAIAGILNAVAKNPTSTSQNMFVMLIARSYAQNYPDLVKLDQILSPLGMQKAALLDKYCGHDLADRVSDVPLSQLINYPVAPGLITALGEGMPGTEKVDVPLMIFQGLKDKTILPQFTHAQVMSQCALGTTVFYVRYPYDDHPSLNFQARLHDPSAIDWMNARWAGEPAPSNCANQLLGTLKTTTKVN